MSAFTDRLDAALLAELAPKGFVLVRPRRWVCSTTGPIRKLFEFQALKGMAYSARWGFSLDFVPETRCERFASKTKLCSKRTAKGAEFDLCIDPIDAPGFVEKLYSVSDRWDGQEVSTSELTLVARTACDIANSDFARVNSVGDIVALFDERSQMRFSRFSLENYIQTHIAWGLALVATGRAAEGDVHIRKFCEHFGVDRAHPLLRKAEAEAARYAEGGAL